jgi:TonB family protein
MRRAPETTEGAEAQSLGLDLRLLVVPDSRTHNFLQNLRELFSSRERITTESNAEDFWSDVFVHGGLPWWRFLQSGAYHAAAILMIWAGSRFLALQPQPTVQPAFTHADVVYYTASEYLSPIDTRRADPAPAEKPDPEYSAQPIISLPPEAENHSQTIVAPPKVRLHHEAALPNVVAWSEKPQIPIAPAPVVLASETSRLTPKISQAVVAPPPEIADRMQPSNREQTNAPQMAVIAPPPDVEADPARRLGDLDIARSTVIAPAPQLSLDEQRAGGRVPVLNAPSMRVIAPPPLVGANSEAEPGRNTIALNLHPAVTPPAEPVAGNRRGNFATTPEGHHGRTGAIDGAGKTATGRGNPTGQAKPTSDLPAGLYVGKTSNPPSTSSGDRPASSSKTYMVNPNLLAEARPPRAPARTLQPESTSKLSEEERAVFGDRKFYSLSLNMPNLNSAGGSWVVRFAALNSSGAPYSERPTSALEGATSMNDLSAPSAIRKVDPAYPLELMRQNVGGTVILYAVIRSDGTVGNIRVLRSVDERLDRYASQAIAKWQFDPARKNGSPVDVEATFRIPFRPAKTGSGF